MTTLKILCVLSLALTIVLSLPINKNLQDEVRVNVLSGIHIKENIKQTAELSDAAKENDTANFITTADRNIPSIQTRNQIRPGMLVSRYDVYLTPNENDGTFTGMVEITVSSTQATREDPIIFHAEDIQVNSVTFAVGGNTVFNTAEDFFQDEGLLEISTGADATIYRFRIEYTGSLTSVGRGFFAGGFETSTYLGMNLHPTNARRVFPCIDELTETSHISFTFNDIPYTNIVINSIETDNANTFQSLEGPPHRWAMVAHTFSSNNVANNLRLSYRQGINTLETLGRVAITDFYERLQQWTEREFPDIMLNQRPDLEIIALPDISKDWYGLGSVGIWEPYIMMETTVSNSHKFQSFTKLAEGIARQWYGYMVFPENYRYQWVISGLASYAAYDVLTEFQTNVMGELDSDMLDIRTLFVTEIFQESLLRDAYRSSTLLEATDDLFFEDEIRDHLNGILKYKAPSVLRMLNWIISPNNDDLVKTAGTSLLNIWSQGGINSLHFLNSLDSLNSNSGTGMINSNEIEEFLEPLLTHNGVPVLNVAWWTGGVTISVERFRFVNPSNPPWAPNVRIPITYSISTAPNFDISQPPISILDGTDSLPMFLDEEDYVLFNIQGQGYYRVNYDTILWERMLEALDDPDRRNQIHPLNRATLLDDVLNLARGGRVDYEIALMVALTWVHETEYAPWRAYVRNMNFLRKRLVALVSDDEDLDPDIYLRMVRRAIPTFEAEIGYVPDVDDTAMIEMTRGLVMDHACRANHPPCIAAAVDWFYDPDSNEPVVNPNIPSELRPAVYCTMVREGGDDVIQALNERLTIEPSMYERVVILESLACSTDDSFINGLLTETIASSTPYTTEERLRIFKAVTESSFANAQLALNFFIINVNQIRNMYGGAEQLEEVIYALGENMANFDTTERFRNFAFNQNNNFEDSQHTANRAVEMADDNVIWDNTFMQYVYDWIDENDAPTLMVSLVLISISFVVTLFNH